MCLSYLTYGFVLCAMLNTTGVCNVFGFVSCSAELYHTTESVAYKQL